MSQAESRKLASLTFIEFTISFDIHPIHSQVTIQKTAPFTNVFAQSLISVMETDRTVVAITAAMPGGTGLDKVGRRFPKRTYDVGIAEQHAVTFAAGMAVEGVKPYCAIYSTFMQRALDQFIHDVALQRLPVRFILDRAGLVGNDGATHHGTFDLAYLGCVPDVVIMAPSDEFELQNMIETSHLINDMPSVVRFPRGNGYGAATVTEMFGTPLPNGDNFAVKGTALVIGKGRIVKQHSTDKSIKVCILSIGTRLMDSVLAAREIEKLHPDTSVTVADARFMKPLDTNLVAKLALENNILITIEEGSSGGFGSAVLQHITDEGLLDRGTLRARSMVIPDIWIEAGPQKDQYDIAQLNHPHITAKIESLLKDLRSHRYDEYDRVKLHEPMFDNITNIYINLCDSSPKRIIDVGAEEASSRRTSINSFPSPAVVFK